MLVRCCSCCSCMPSLRPGPARVRVGISRCRHHRCAPRCTLHERSSAAAQVSWCCQTCCSARSGPSSGRCCVLQQQLRLGAARRCGGAARHPTGRQQQNLANLPAPAQRAARSTRSSCSPAGVYDDRGTAGSTPCAPPYPTVAPLQPRPSNPKVLCRCWVARRCRDAHGPALQAADHQPASAAAVE